jgi:hypothetical protein
LLDQMRQAGDPPADAVVQELDDDDEIDAVNRLMQTLVRNDDVPRAKLPRVVRSYLESTDDLRDWADPERIAIGAEFFGVHGPTIVMAFACASLPKCYAFPKGVQVLHLTARLQSDPVRRIAETAQLILDVMEPGGLGFGGRGIRDAQKVRLMHAAVRRLCSRSEHWNTSWDTPINQEDLAGGLCTFSIVPLEALQQLGTTVSDDEADGDEIADMLGVESHNWASLLTGPLRLFASHSDAVADNVPFAGRISAHFSQQLLEGLSWVARGGDRAPFRIPQELAERWDVRTAERAVGYW